MNEGLVIEGIGELSEAWKTNPVLIIQHADKQPPHIALGFEGRYFSVSVKKVEAGSELSSRINSLQKLNVLSLLFMLCDPLHEILTPDVSAVFSAYKPLQPGETCLAPVLDFFRIAYSISPAKPLVFGLLEELYASKCVASVEQIGFSDESLVNGSFVLKYYTCEVVQERIEALINKKS